MFKKIGQVMVYVNDLDASKSFWTEKERQLIDCEDFKNLSFKTPIESCCRSF